MPDLSIALGIQNWQISLRTTGANAILCKLAVTGAHVRFITSRFVVPQRRDAHKAFQADGIGIRAVLCAA